MLYLRMPLLSNTVVSDRQNNLTENNVVYTSVFVYINK